VQSRCKSQDGKWNWDLCFGLVGCGIAIGGLVVAIIGLNMEMKSTEESLRNYADLLEDYGTLSLKLKEMELVLSQVNPTMVAQQVAMIQANATKLERNIDNLKDQATDIQSDIAGVGSITKRFDALEDPASKVIVADAFDNFALTPEANANSVLSFGQVLAPQGYQPFTHSFEARSGYNGFFLDDVGVAHPVVGRPPETCGCSNWLYDGMDVPDRFHRTEGHGEFPSPMFGNRFPECHF